MSQLIARSATIPSPLIREQVVARMADVAMASAQKAFLDALRPGELKCAPQATPLIATGMAVTMQKLKSIIMAPRGLTPEEYAQVPDLLRRMRHLLRVFYDAKISRRKTVEFRFCDYKDIDDVGPDLHEMGLTLQLTPGRLRALFKHAPDMDAFLFEEPIDLGNARISAFARKQAVDADPESTDDDRVKAGQLEDQAQNDLAAYQMIFFVTDLLVGWLVISPADAIERRRASRALQRFVELSTAPLYRHNDAFGDALTTCSRPVYALDSLAVKCARAGWLPAMFDDWAVSVAKDGYVKYALEQLPSRAWESQSEASLVSIMLGLLKKLEAEGSNVVTNSIFIQAIHEINSRYGYDIFQKGSAIQHHEILFYFLHRRISRKPEAYTTKQSIRSLLKKYTRVARTSSKRYIWSILPVAARWDCISLYGCVNAKCPEREALLELRSKRQRGVRDPVVEERLFQWGGLSKACTSCRHVSYCSSACQKADWAMHKADCKKRTPKDKSEVELEI